MGNQIRTAFLLAVMTVFLILIGRLIGGPTGMAVAFVFAIGMNFFSYWFSDKIVLRAGPISPPSGTSPVPAVR